MIVRTRELTYRARSGYSQPRGQPAAVSVLRTIEHKIESLFEGVFGRAFRTHVQPVELARKLQKEMDDHRVVSVSRVYVPNEYTIYLCPDDREQFSAYETRCASELQEYLAEHARREDYALLAHPRVSLETDDDLAGRRVRDRDPHGAAAARAPRAPPRAAAGRATMVYPARGAAGRAARPTAPAPSAR